MLTVIVRSVMSEEKKQKLKEYQKNCCQKQKKDFFALYKMRKVLDFNKEYVFKNESDKNIEPLFIDNIVINKTVLSKKELYGNKGVYKNYIGYNLIYIKPLYIKLPKVCVLIKHDKDNKVLSFLADNKNYCKNVKIIKTILKYFQSM